MVLEQKKFENGNTISVVENSLSDNSKIYDVVIANNGEDVVCINACNYRYATNLFDIIVNPDMIVGITI